MERTNILPTDKEAWLALRGQDITSTDVSALFGLSPYTTAFELWQKKAGKLDDSFEETERMKWGTRLQDTIARGIGEDEGWNVRARNVYTRIPDRRIGASFDFEIVSHADGPGLLEIKNVDYLVYRDQWTEEDGVIEAPAHIELQLQHQLLATGRSWGVIAALVAGNTVKLVRRKADLELQESILTQTAVFWASIAADCPPAPDYKADFKTLKKLLGPSQEGLAIDARGNAQFDDLVAQYAHVSSEIKGLEEIKEATKAQLLELTGGAEKVIGSNWSISAGTVAAKEIPATVRQAYRNFRVNLKKSAK